MPEQEEEEEELGVGGGTTTTATPTVAAAACGGAEEPDKEQRVPQQETTTRAARMTSTNNDATTTATVAVDDGDCKNGTENDDFLGQDKEEQEPPPQQQDELQSADDFSVGGATHENDDDDWDDFEETEAFVERPIVVGYAFGPKKMSTMGIVMAEASRTRLSTVRPVMSSSRSTAGAAATALPNQKPVAALASTLCHGALITPAPCQEEPAAVNTDVARTEEDDAAAPAALEENTIASAAMKRAGSSPRAKKKSSAFSASATTTSTTTSTTAASTSAASAFAESSSNPPPPASAGTTLAATATTSKINSPQQHAATATAAATTPPRSNYTNSTPQKVEIIFDLRKIVRHFHTSCSSVADSATTNSTGTRTASRGGGHSSSAASMSRSQSQRGQSQSQSQSQSHSQTQQVRVSFVPLDPDIPLEEQHGGRIDVILHKLTEDILCKSQMERQVMMQQQTHGTEHSAAADESSQAAVRRVQRLCDFASATNTPLMDHPVAVQRLMDRAQIAHTLRACLKGVQSASGRPVAAPPYAILECNGVVQLDAVAAVREACLDFPLLCKPLTAAGTKASHHMAIVLEASALDRVPRPCLCQAYVNHDATLYKVYVLGELISVHKRRSLPNLPRGPNEDDALVQQGKSSSSTSPIISYMAFDSQRPYPRLRDFGYEAATSAAPTTNSTNNTGGAADTAAVTSEPGRSAAVVTDKEVGPVVQALKQAFQLELFGFDVLVACETGELLVVDVNYFPSYKEVPNFAARLAKFLTDKALEKRRQEEQSRLQQQQQQEQSLSLQESMSTRQQTPPLPPLETDKAVVALALPDDPHTSRGTAAASEAV